MTARKGRKEKGDERECVCVRKGKGISRSVCVRGRGEKGSKREWECICLYINLRRVVRNRVGEGKGGKACVLE